MDYLAKYRALVKQGFPQDEVYQRAKQDGLEAQSIYHLLVDVLGHTHVAAYNRLKDDGYQFGQAALRLPSAPVVKRDQFRRIFDTALAVTARVVELDRIHSSRTFAINLLGIKHTRHPLNPDEVFDLLYLGDELFYPIIDVIITNVTDEQITLRLIVSGHPPVPFSNTWNDPEGAGPFKLVVASDEARRIAEDMFSQIDYG